MAEKIPLGWTPRTIDAFTAPFCPEKAEQLPTSLPKPEKPKRNHHARKKKK